MKTNIKPLVLALGLGLVLLAPQQASAYYNSTTGRWLTRDPINEAGGHNSYVFVVNRPETKFDLLGAFPMGYYLEYDSSQEYSIRYYKRASLNLVHYPKNGQRCACRGRFIGGLALDIWLDADPQATVQEAFPSDYAFISQWPFWSPGSLQTFNTPAYVGAGISILMAPSDYRSICCPTLRWKQWIKRRGPDKADGNYTGLWYMDSPGGLISQILRSQRVEFRLALYCEGGGFAPELLGEWEWSYRILIGPPLRVELVTPF